MSRARHHERKRARGGLTSKPQWNAGGTQNAAKEAEERRRGGRVHTHGEGMEPKHRADRMARGGRKHHRAHGGEVTEHHMHHHLHGHEGHEERAHGGKVTEHHMHHHHHTPPGRKRGGKIGANLTPLSTAARVQHVTKGELPEEGVPSD